MKRKGFTLVELLAVIVILAIIALIAVPTILGLIDKTKKGAFKASVLGVIEAGEFYIATNNVEYNENEELVFTCNGTDCSNEQGKLAFKGEVPTSGSVIVKKDGTIEVVLLTNKNYCASGNKKNIEIQKDCADVVGIIYANQVSYETEYNENITNVEEALDDLYTKN